MKKKSQIKLYAQLRQDAPNHTRLRLSGYACGDAGLNGVGLDRSVGCSGGFSEMSKSEEQMFHS